MHAVIRRYVGATPLMDAMERSTSEIETLITSVPGFAAYHAIRQDDTLVTISVFRDQAGTDESTRRAAEWVRENLPAGSIRPPEVTEGEVFIHFAAAQAGAVGTARV